MVDNKKDLFIYASIHMEKIKEEETTFSFSFKCRLALQHFISWAAFMRIFPIRLSTRKITSSMDDLSTTQMLGV